MKIAILGAGFTGLAAALKLLEKGHQVTLIEKEETVGGLAGGFKLPSWEWTLEKSYHHWFTNDTSALNLAKRLNYPVIIKRPSTDILAYDHILPLDSPSTLLRFPYLNPVDKFRTASALAFLKFVPYQFLGNQKALPWIRKVMGKKSASLIWEPLFTGKFSSFGEEIALIWFWARIKKRTSSLAYPQGGFLSFAEKIATEIKRLGGEILLNTELLKLTKEETECTVIARSPSTTLRTTKQSQVNVIKPRGFDKIIVTLPSPIFTKVTPGLPQTYVKRISSIPHLFALNLILVLKKPFLDKSYWLNITEKDFPFLVLAEHTNFMEAKHYGNQHILYIGNYLPEGHPYLKMSAEELLKVFDPYLKKINPNYKFYIQNYKLLISPYAQPIVTTDYPKLIPEFETPVKDIYLANMDMVYPWDRGTNYAIEMGERVAELVDDG